MKAGIKQINRCGFNLVELAVVLSVLGVLMGLLLPAIQRSRGSANRLKCLNNLKQIGLALHHAHDTHGRLPPYRSLPIGSIQPDYLLTWQAQVLPEMDQASLWQLSAQACAVDPIPFHNPPHLGYSTVIPTYVCPSDPRLYSPLTTPSGDFCAFTSYIGVGGCVTFRSGSPMQLRGAMGDVPGIRFTDITDGTSNTLLVGERPPPNSLQAGRWYSVLYGREPNCGPEMILTVNGGLGSPFDIQCSNARTDYFFGRLDNPCDRFHFWSLHPAGANFVLADGSARFVPYSAAGLLPALASRAGGETVQLPD